MKLQHDIGVCSPRWLCAAPGSAPADRRPHRRIVRASSSGVKGPFSIVRIARQMISPHLYLKINGAEQIDRSLVAGAHASLNLVEANEYAADLRRAPSRPARISRFPALSEVSRAILRDTRDATRPDPRE